MIPSGHKVREDSKMLKSFGLDQEVMSANGRVCGGGIKSRNAPGTIPKGCPGALLLPAHRGTAGPGLFFPSEGPSQTWASPLTVTAFTEGISRKRQHFEGSVCAGCLHSPGEV